MFIIIIIIFIKENFVSLVNKHFEEDHTKSSLPTIHHYQNLILNIKIKIFKN